MEINELEKQLADTCQKIYELGEQRFKPLYPWLLVRVLPKEQKVGTLWLPEKQNKVLYEGIVLETWGESKGRKSEVKRGDRVWFPHYEGMPCSYLNENHYRLIREYTTDVNCGTFGKIRYAENNRVAEKLNELFEGMTCVTVTGK